MGAENVWIRHFNLRDGQVEASYHGEEKSKMTQLEDTRRQFNASFIPYQMEKLNSIFEFY